MGILFSEVNKIFLHSNAAVVCKITDSKGSVPRKKDSIMIVDDRGKTFGSVGGGALELLCIEKALQIYKTHKGYTQHFDLAGKLENGKSMICGGDVTIEFSYVENPEQAKDLFAFEDEQITVYIFGGGHVGTELVPVLEHVNFKVIILDNRKEFADPLRHPKAEKSILCDYSDISKSVEIKKGDYVAVMTHGHLNDREILLQVMRTEASYIGCIGSKRKVAETKAFLLEQGIDAEKVEKLHSPIGIEIYGDTPQEISISIAAEMIKHRALAEF